MKDHKRFYPAKLLSIDAENHQVWARFTDDQPDREGDIMDGNTWQFDDWMKAPVVLFGHKDWELPIGRGLEIRKVEENGVIAHEALIEFDVTDPESARVWGKVERGFLKTLSVGYVTQRREGNRLLDNLLTEISFVPVPANINAMVRSLTDGSVSVDDAKWLKKNGEAMVKSLTEYIQNSDNDSNANDSKGKGAKSMSDEDLKKVADLVKETVAEAVKPVADDVAGLKTSVEALSKQSNGDDDKSKANSGKSDEGTDDDDISDDEVDEILAQVDAMLADDDDSNSKDNDKDEES